MKRRTRHLKNAILKTVTVVSISILFGLDIDKSESLILPFILYGLSLAWLYLFNLANSSERRKRHG